MPETCLRRKTADGKINLCGATTLKSVGGIFMTREFLKQLGIEDKTVIDSIMDENGSVTAFQSTPS